MTDFAGKAWFRANIIPYLTTIKANSTSGGGTPPLVTSHAPVSIGINTVTTIAVTGDFFTPTMAPTCPTGTVTNYVFISQQSCTFDITFPSDQTNTITLTTVGGSTTINIDSTVSNWIDLRAGGDTYTETHKSGTTISQDATGLRSTGALWSNWLKIDSESWLRANPSHMSMIIKVSGTAMMAGIMGSDQVPSASSQYYQAEIYSYIPSTYCYGFYGTNAGHNGVNSNLTNIQISSYAYTKLVWEHSGEVGYTMKVYGLTDLTDLDDLTNLLGTHTVPATFTADSVTLYPCVTMGTQNQRLVAVKVEAV